MKKFVLLALFALAIPTQSQAACFGGIECIGSAPAAGYGGPALLPFTTALGFGLLVEYLDATGVPFPLCGVGGLKCYYTYPGDK